MLEMLPVELDQLYNLKLMLRFGQKSIQHSDLRLIILVRHGFVIEVKQDQNKFKMTSMFLV